MAMLRPAHRLMLHLIWQRTNVSVNTIPVAPHATRALHSTTTNPGDEALLVVQPTAVKCATAIITQFLAITMFPLTPFPMTRNKVVVVYAMHACIIRQALTVSSAYLACITCPLSPSLVTILALYVPAIAKDRFPSTVPIIVVLVTANPMFKDLNVMLVFREVIPSVAAWL